MKIFYGKCSNTFVSHCICTYGIVSLKWLIDGLYIIAPWNENLLVSKLRALEQILLITPLFPLHVKEL